MDQTLTERQLNVGAAYLAAVDTGRLTNKKPPLPEAQLIAALERIDKEYAIEDVGIFAIHKIDLDYFKKQLQKGDLYFVTAIKENLPWLFPQVAT